MCSGQAFELATTTERLQVGGGYTVLQKTRHGILAKLGRVYTSKNNYLN